MFVSEFDDVVASVFLDEYRVLPFLVVSSLSDVAVLYCSGDVEGVFEAFDFGLECFSVCLAVRF
ncbi:MAG: hypothetical protein ACI3Z7_01435 [Candidatus Aphodosoma sp.]